ncbi:MAG: 6-phosphofructokinase [Lentisphaerae bacterium]|nr:6-phosphofructokinase [Lentisphaerota bacterium]MCP4100923.1 6-phosphofructokinase [Lentisphaerota bacterium]
MTSGGDAQGMNAAVRAVVRTGIATGCRVYAIREGYQGMVDNNICEMDWEDVSGILQLGGTSIGTARCHDFRERDGRMKAAANLIAAGIDRLVIIGGDGSLTGANQFRQEWPELLAELVRRKIIDVETMNDFPELKIVGLVGSIDNDMANTDMTIGADSALHRITEAIDALSSTAHSHQRIFVVEVMGRNCGYLALMSGISTGASYVFVPEFPPEDGWEKRMCELLSTARKAGRRDSIVIVAEGARDRHHNPITSNYIKEVLDKGMGMESRITILGHVQRGGAPSAFDRYMSTACGAEAVSELLEEKAQDESKIVVLQNNRIKTASLMDSVQKTRAISDCIKNGEYKQAMELRGSNWNVMSKILETMCLAMPPEHKKHSKRIAIMTCGWPAPGMNDALRTAVRIGLANGYKMLGINNGVEGLVNDEVKEFDWMDVEDLNGRGGSQLGTNRKIPAGSDFLYIADAIIRHKIKGVLLIGGWTGYQIAQQINRMRPKYSAFDMPIVCIPASINNNLPGSELSIGSDTALNTIVEAIDKIKQSADTAHRAFIVEVMGRYCGYLALMSGLATGAEFIYMHEKGVTLEMMRKHLKKLSDSFNQDDRSVALMVRNEKANSAYTTDFMCRLFDEASGDLFDVRRSILGPIQQGGKPSPFDRIQAARLAYEGMNQIFTRLKTRKTESVFIGQRGGKTSVHPVAKLHQMASPAVQRPHKQWWEDLVDMTTMLAIRPQ